MYFVLYEQNGSFDLKINGKRVEIKGGTFRRYDILPQGLGERPFL